LVRPLQEKTGRDPGTSDFPGCIINIIDMKFAYINIGLISLILGASCSLFMPCNRKAAPVIEFTLIDIATSPYLTIDSTSADSAVLARPSPVNDYPFARNDQIRLQLEDESHVRIELIGAMGELMLIWEDQNLPGGNYELDFRGINVFAEIYFFKSMINGEMLKKGVMFLSPD